MRMRLSLSRAIMHSVVAHSHAGFVRWQRRVARRRLRQLRALRLAHG
jgi:hypothetical protein